MRLINFLISNTLSTIFLYYFIKEYYSPLRLLKGLKNLYKNLKGKWFFFFLLAYFLIPFFNFYIFWFLIHIYYIILIIKIPKLKFKLHARGIRLLVFTIILNSIFLFINRLFAVFLLLIFPIINIIIANILLYPCENFIRKKYIKKARQKLKKIDPLIIGITGSFSKTTFKTYLHHFLGINYCVYKSEGNINTLMGLTKWINDCVDPLCEVLILEIGIDKNHGIKKFKKLFTLDIGVITSVGKMHLSTFKTYSNIVQSKCEIDYLMKEQGLLFINDNYDDLKKYDYKHFVKFYGKKHYDDKLNKFQNEAIDGVFMISQFLNIPENKFKSYLQKLPNIPRRFQIKENENMIVINDSYNINYNGVVESLNYMRKYNYKKIVVTGGLIELGTFYNEENYKLGKQMYDVDYLFLISSNKNHPLKKGYEEISKNKCILVDNFNKVKVEIDKIDDKKIILLTAQGGDFFVE